MRQSIKYYDKNTNEIVEVIDLIAAGMCKRTIGKTFVIYKIKEIKYYMIMNYIEFYEKYEKK